MNETEMALKTHVTENKENIKIVSQTLSRTRCKGSGLFDGANCSVVVPEELLALLKAPGGPELEAGLIRL